MAIKRIPASAIHAGQPYRDGEIITGTMVNEVVKVLKDGVNYNKFFIDAMFAGTTEEVIVIGVASLTGDPIVNDIAQLEDFVTDNGITVDDGQKAFVFRCIYGNVDDPTEITGVQALNYYKYSDSTGDWIHQYVVSMDNFIQGLSSDFADYDEVTTLADDDLFVVKDNSASLPKKITKLNLKETLGVDNVNQRVDDIVDGTTIVKKAEQDKNGNNIVATYETKSIVSGINGRVTSLENANMIKSYTYNPATHVITFTYYDNTTTSFDLPLESAIVSASYDDNTQDITFVLQSGATLVVPLDDLVSGLASETWVTTYFIPKTALKTSWSATPLDTNVPSEKLTKETLDAKVPKSDIVDNLTTDDATEVLSAKQGKVLQDTKAQVNKTINLFNKDTALSNKRALGNVDVSDASGYYVTDYIPVSMGDVLITSYDVLGVRTLLQIDSVAIYNSSKTFIARASVNGVNRFVNTYTVSVTNTAYVRLSYTGTTNVEDRVHKKVMIEKSSTISSIYYRYGYNLQEYVYYNNRSNSVDSKWKGKNVLVFGDSISSDTFGNYKKWNHYLEEEKDFTMINYSIHGYGVLCGQDTPNQGAYNLINQIENAKTFLISNSITPDLIIIFMGTNDYGNHVPLGTYGTALNSDLTTNITNPNSITDFTPAFEYCMAKILEYWTASTVCTLLPLKRLNHTFESKNLKSYADVLKNVSEKFSTPVLDLYTDGSFNPDNPAFNTMWCRLWEGSPDGLHPNELFNEIKLMPKIGAFIETI